MVENSYLSTGIRTWELFLVPFSTVCPCLTPAASGFRSPPFSALLDCPCLSCVLGTAGASHTSAPRDFSHCFLRPPPFFLFSHVRWGQLLLPKGSLENWDHTCGSPGHMLREVLPPVMLISYLQWEHELSDSPCKKLPVCLYRITHVFKWLPHCFKL